MLWQPYITTCRPDNDVGRLHRKHNNHIRSRDRCSGRAPACRHCLAACCNSWGQDVACLVCVKLGSVCASLLGAIMREPAEAAIGRAGRWAAVPGWIGDINCRCSTHHDGSDLPSDTDKSLFCKLGSSAGQCGGLLKCMHLHVSVWDDPMSLWQGRFPRPPKTHVPPAWWVTTASAGSHPPWNEVGCSSRPA